MNPEFRRNLWLEFSTERLLIVPAVVALAAIAVTGTLGRSIALNIATYAAIAIGIIWGSTQASASLLNEITARTWDMQRASSLSGWQMTWGKLFGATAYTWYALAIVAFAWLSLDGPASPGREEWLLLVPATVLAQALALIAALHMPVDGRVHVRGVRQAAMIGVLGGLVALQIARALGVAGLPIWYAVVLDHATLLLLSLLFLGLWAVIGAWRSMCAALQIPLSAWGWPLFLITLSIWVAGFAAGGDAQMLLSRRLHAALAATWVATWFAALIEIKSPVALRHWGMALASGEFGMLLRRTPAWLVGLPILLALAIGVGMTGGLSFALPRVVAFVPFVGPALARLTVNFGTWLPIVGVLLLLWRDIAIMYWAGMIGRARRVAALIYLAALYILVPIALLALDWLFLLPAFVPLPFADDVFDVAFIVLVIEVAGATALAAGSIRRLTRLMR